MLRVGRGEVLVSLCWQPAAARLTVVLLKARNLPKMDVTGLADPCVPPYRTRDTGLITHAASSRRKDA